MPLAPKPKSAMLITINERWCHCPMANTRVRRTSKARVENETVKMAVRSMVQNLISAAVFINSRNVTKKEKVSGFRCQEQRATAGSSLPVRRSLGRACADHILQSPMA